MAIVHREARQLPDWTELVLPERWRQLFDLDLERDGWLRIEQYQDGGTLVLRSEVPGVDPEKDIEVTVGDGVLRVRAHREMKAEQKNKKGYRSEFRYGELTRTIPLPEGFSGDVKATYDNGVLEVRVPIPAEKEPEVKKVPVTRV
jgi:HSP20 family protein